MKEKCYAVYKCRWCGEVYTHSAPATVDDYPYPSIYLHHYSGEALDDHYCIGGGKGLADFVGLSTEPIGV